MITHDEMQYINKNAYIPEHLIDYVVAISDAEPFLWENYVFYVKNKHLIFIGYPLKKSFNKDDARKVLISAVDKLKSKTVAIITPGEPIFKNLCIMKSSDYYYILNLSNFILTSKLKNSINRALKETELVIDKKVTSQHLCLIEEVISYKKFDEYTQYIFKKIPDYVKSSSTVQVFSAFDRKGNLVGFDIADCQSEKFCFYMFNFISRKNYIPGISDLLFYEIVKKAKYSGKLFINMGLGINEGVVFFKRKWGAERFLPYEFYFYRKSFRIFDIFKKILRKQIN